MLRELSILQAYLQKMSPLQDALYNDPEVWRFDAILIQEPHYLELEDNVHITGVGPNFELVKPRLEGRQGQRARSCIWANKKNEFQQIQTGNADTTIIRISIDDRHILIASVYIPCARTQTEEGERGRTVD